MSCVIDLASRRARPAMLSEIVHPAGVRLPIDDPAALDFVIPEIRGEIAAGEYSADLIRHVSRSVCPGDRVLVIGAGLGVVSAFAGKLGTATRVLAVEADPRLIPYMKRVHAMNGVAWVEPVNAVLATHASACAQFYPRRDIRASSLLPSRRMPAQPVQVPCMDLNLILRDEKISMILCEIPGASMRLLAESDLDHVERILIDCGMPVADAPDSREILALMEKRGFVARTSGPVMLLDRTGTARNHATGALTNAGATRTRAAHCR